MTAEFFSNPVYRLLGMIFLLLAVASCVSFILQRRDGPDSWQELRQRIQSWWVMVIVFSLAISLSRNISLVFFGFLSFLALKEYLSIIPTRRADRRVLFWAYLAIPFQYFWIGTEWYGMFVIFIPVYVFLLLPMRMVLIGDTRNFLRAAGTVHWGVMTTVFSISHLACLLVLPESGNPGAGGAGLVLYLVFLTQANDVSQYLWGKTLGNRPIVPQVSPNKTWGGFLGGVGTTSLLAWLLSGWLTPLTSYEALAAGVLISVFGFIGDVTISAVKRDIGVKDSGAMLPGHGGILDRVDSLTYTAPLFFHFVYFLYF